MKVVLQRVKEANVRVEKELVGEIGAGLLILVGITKNDTETDVEWLTKKVINLRIFSDLDGNMNLSLKDVKGQILLISQFTLYASTRKGNRPSFINAAKPEQARILYDVLKDKLEAGINGDIVSGIFGADMQIGLINDGPVTIVLDSKSRE